MKAVQIIILVGLLVVIIFGASTLFEKDSYVGFYYPDANNLANNIQSLSSFETLEACRDWADAQTSIHNPDRTNLDDYECGKNCKLQAGQKPYICEETLQ